MKAARVHKPGGREAVMVEDVPAPSGSGVRVHIEAAGVNPIDWKLRAGWFAPAPLPFILGQDIAGVVMAASERFKPGDAVYAMLPMDMLGGYADQAIVPDAALALRPASLSAETAAAVPMGALTAWAALFDVADLKPGERVLIHGGGGAVGSFAVQLARATGAWVATTASGKDLAWLGERGADRVIDFRAERFEDALGGDRVDLVLDVLGGETQARSWSVLRDGGRMVSTLGATEPPAGSAARGLPGFDTAPHGARLSRIAAMIDDGTVAVRAPQVMPLSAVADALDQVEHGRAAGKIVLSTGQG